MKIRHLALAASLGAVAAVSATAQVAPPPPTAPTGPAPGSGNAATMSDRLREDNATYNRAIGSADLKGSRKGEGKRAAKPQAVPASLSDITAGSALRDINGTPIGSIEAADAGGAVVVHATGKVKVPLEAFGKDDYGLLLGTTAEKFQELVAKAAAAK